MKLYEATYNIKWLGSGLSPRITQYILAPDFQTAAKLAETSKKITSESGGSGCPIAGASAGSALVKIEEIADVRDFHDTATLDNIGSHMFSIVDNKLLKVELLAINVIEE